jgi:hypothetical protein
MKFLRTKSCAKYGHAEFKIQYDPAVVVVEDDAKWLIGWLEDSVSQGSQYTPNQTCQIGWGLTQVRPCPGGELTLWEPDMLHFPIQWSEGVTRTLAHLRLQKDAVESVLPADSTLFPTMQQSALICNRLMDGEGIVLERAEPKNSDSGWYCGCRNNDHDHNNADELLCVSLYDVALRAPQVVQYLALPPEMLVAIDSEGPIVFRNGQQLDFRPGSFLAAKYPS